MTVPLKIAYENFRNTPYPQYVQELQAQIGRYSTRQKFSVGELVMLWGGERFHNTPNGTIGVVVEVMEWQIGEVPPFQYMKMYRVDTGAISSDDPRQIDNFPIKIVLVAEQHVQRAPRLCNGG